MLLENITLMIQVPKLQFLVFLFIKDIKKELSQTISSLRKGGDPNKLRQLNIQLKRIKKAGGFDKIVPSEGIVFDYKSNTYKLTGVFAPINQILGMSKF